MEDERIEAVKNWLKPKSVKDIQVFLRFANFYQRFFHIFNKIAGPLTLILKTTRSAKNLSSIMAENTEFSSVGSVGDCKDEMVEKSPFTSKNSNRVIGNLTSNAKRAFTQLR